MLREPKTIVDADKLGVDALTFIAGREDLLHRFIDVTGFNISQLRQEATRPGFFVAVLDFILANEPDVIELSTELSVPPTAIGRARNALAAKAGIPLEDFPS